MVPKPACALVALEEYLWLGTWVPLTSVLHVFPRHTAVQPQTVVSQSNVNRHPESRVEVEWATSAPLADKNIAWLELLLFTFLRARM